MPMSPERKRGLRAERAEIRAAQGPDCYFDLNDAGESDAWKADRHKVAQALDLRKAGRRHLSEVLSYDDLTTIYFAETKKIKGTEIPSPFESKILGQFYSFDGWLALRDKARKNLFWLGHEVFKKGLMIPRTHQPTCDQFVQKNFDDKFPQGYTIDDVHDAIRAQERYDSNGNPTRDMVLLDARGFLKSTIDGVDAIQWMINVPDIRIMIVTGEYKLATAFMDEIKGYLHQAEQADPTDFQLLFPEYIIRGVDGTSKEPIWLPCRKHNQKEGSLWVNSIDSNLSGWHCDVLKSDDFVTDENCNTDGTRAAINFKFDGVYFNNLDDWGICDSIGTRYHPLKKNGIDDDGEIIWDGDWYAIRLQRSVEDPEDSAVKFFCRAALYRKPEYVDEKEFPLRKLTQDMVDLTFPEKADWKSLKKKMKNLRQFRCQQLNDPPSGEEDSKFAVTFNEDVLRRHMYLSNGIPRHGEVFVCWDWASTANKHSDYSVGIAAKVYRKDPTDPNSPLSLCILEVKCGKWKSSELAYIIVQFEKTWNPKRTIIEASVGSELLRMEIQRQAVRYNIIPNIYWKTPSNEDNAKRNRIKNLEILLADDRLWFVAGPWIDETFLQMTKYTGEKKNRGKKDDIPDAMAYLAFFLGFSPNTASDEDLKKIREEQAEKAREKAQYDRMFNNNGGFTSPAVPVVDERPQDPRRAGMQAIFGGNGIRV